MKKQSQVKFRNKRDHKAGVAVTVQCQPPRQVWRTTRKDLSVSGPKMKEEKFPVPYTTAHTVDHERCRLKPRALIQAKRKHKLLSLSPHPLEG